jgi:hypothetical protein
MSRFAMLACAIAALALGVAAGPSRTTAPEVHDMLAAEQAGLVSVRYIPNDSRSAQIVVASRTDRPLTLRLPAAFAGVPVLAQMAGGGQAGFGAGGIGAAPQSTGGGVANQGMGIGGGGGAAFCWVAREVYGVHDPRWLEFRGWLQGDAPAWLREAYVAHGEEFAAWIHDKPLAKQAVRGLMDGVLDARATSARGGQFRVADRGDGSFVVPPGGTRTFRFATVCLEHGKPEPSPRIAYRLEPLESFSDDPRLAFVMASQANGQVSQKAAQAAAWHIASGLSWQRLEAEMIDHAGGDLDEPFFAPNDLAVARKLVEVAEEGTAKTASPGGGSSAAN